jgi:hypothetical protein
MNGLVFEIPPKIICPVCEEKGLRSCSYPGEPKTTKKHCPGYYDPDGNFHDHDRNVTSVDFVCSKGHKWVRRTTKKCWCGWKIQEDEIEVTNK